MGCETVCHQGVRDHFLDLDLEKGGVDRVLQAVIEVETLVAIVVEDPDPGTGTVVDTGSANLKVLNLNVTAADER
jgi:hypothetical protein